MALNIGSLVAAIRADEQPFTRALQDATLRMNGFTRHTDGSLRDIHGRFVTQSEAINGTIRSRFSAAISAATEQVKKFGPIAAKSLGMIGVAVPGIAAASTALMGFAAGAVSAGLAVGAFQAAVKPQMQGMKDAAAAADKLATAQENEARKGALAAKLKAEGSDLAEKAAKAYTTARLATKDAEAAYQRQTKDMPKATAEAALAQAKLKDAHKSWSDSLASTTMPVFTQGLNLLRGLLPTLTPFVKAAAESFGNLLTKIKEGTQSAGFKKFADDMANASGGNLTNLITGLGHLAKGFFGLMQAFLPVSDGMTGGFANMMRAFSSWSTSLGDSQGFAQFIELAKNGGAVLGTLATAALDLLSALSPLIGITAMVASWLAKLISAIPPEVLSMIAQGIGIIVLAVKAYTLYVRIAAAVTRAWAIAQGLLNAVMMLNPVGLVIAAIIALVAIIVLAYNKSETFRKIVQAVWEGIKTGLKAAVDFIVAAFKWFIDLHVKVALWFLQAKDAAVKKMVELVIWLGGLPGRIMGAISSLATSLAVSAGQWWQNFKDTSVRMAVALVLWLQGLPGRVMSSIASLAGKLVTAASQWWQKFKDTSVRLALGLVSWLVGLPGRILGTISSLASSLAGSASRAWQSFKDAGIRKAAEFIVYVRGLPGKITSGIGNLGSLLYDKGVNVVQGLWNGIKSMGGWIKDQIMGWASSVIPGPIAKALGIASPSKVTKAQGQWVAKGLVVGLLGSTKQIQAAASKLAGIVSSALAGSKNKKKRTNAYAIINKGTKQLLALANREAYVAAKLKAANAQLNSLIKARSELAAKVKQGVLESGQITKMSAASGPLRASDILQQLLKKAADAQKFAMQLATLRKKGVRADIIAQIAQAGVEEGSAAAAALAETSPDSIKQINAAQAKLVDAATKAGNTAGDAMYGAGIQAAQGLVKGLQKEQKAIEKQMLLIAVGMQKAIKKALGIKSPSRVMMAVGRFIPAGLVKGINRGKGAVDASMANLVNVPRPGGIGVGLQGGPASGTASTATPVIRVVVDPSQASGDDLLKWLRKTIRIESGGNVQLALGR